VLVMTSCLRRAFTVFRARRKALALASVVGVLGLSGAAALVPTSTANAAVLLQYQSGYYLQNGWYCYGWDNGTYRCTHHWHGAAGGGLVSDNPAWVPNGISAQKPAPVHHSAPAPVHRAAPAPVHHAAPAPRVASGGSVASQIKAVFGPYSAQALRVATCESGLNPNAVNRSSGASGVFQFLASSWATTSYAGYSRFNASANIKAAYEVFVRDGHSWREWSCKP
jgi:hypothetical protein